MFVIYSKMTWTMRSYNYYVSNAHPNCCATSELQIKQSLYMKTRVVSCFCLRWLNILDTVFSKFFLFAVIVCYPTNKHFLVFVTFNLSNLFFPIQETIRKQQHSLKFVYKTKNCELSYSIITQCLRLEIPPNETKEGKISKINKWNLNLFSPYRDHVPTWNYNVNTK